MAKKINPGDSLVAYSDASGPSDLENPVAGLGFVVQDGSGKEVLRANRQVRGIADVCELEAMALAWAAANAASFEPKSLERKVDAASILSSKKDGLGTWMGFARRLVNEEIPRSCGCKTTISKICRDKNKEADKLAKVARHDRLTGNKLPMTFPVLQTCLDDPAAALPQNREGKDLPDEKVTETDKAHDMKAPPAASFSKRLPKSRGLPLLFACPAAYIPENKNEPASIAFTVAKPGGLTTMAAARQVRQRNELEAQACAWCLLNAGCLRAQSLVLLTSEELFENEKYSSRGSWQHASRYLADMFLPTFYDSHVSIAPPTSAQAETAASLARECSGGRKKRMGTPFFSINSLRPFIQT